jgi:acetyl esterase/lipase
MADLEIVALRAQLAQPLRAEEIGQRRKDVDASAQAYPTASDVVAAAIDVQLQVWPEMIHVWHLFRRELSAERRAINQGGDFIRSRIDGGQR